MLLRHGLLLQRHLRDAIADVQGMQLDVLAAEAVADGLADAVEAGVLPGLLQHEVANAVAGAMDVRNFKDTSDDGGRERRRVRERESCPARWGAVSER